MAKELDGSKKGATAPKPVAQSLPKTTPLTPSPALVPGNSAVTTAITLGGNPTGRGREDGLTPNSAEARAADLRKDAERKKAARAIARSITNPPLPSHLPGAPGSPAPLAPHAGSDVSILGTPKAPWTAPMLEPSLTQVIGFWEESKATAREKKALAANLSEALVRDLANDSKFPEDAKRGIVEGVADLSVEGLNYVGVDSKYNRVLGMVTGFLLIQKKDSDTDKRLDELIRLQKQALAKPAGAA